MTTTPTPDEPFCVLQIVIPHRQKIEISIAMHPEKTDQNENDQIPETHERAMRIIKAIQGAEAND